jgi:hypothetical protein
LPEGLSGLFLDHAQDIDEQMQHAAADFFPVVAPFGSAFGGLNRLAIEDNRPDPFPAILLGQRAVGRQHHRNR